MNRTIIYQKKDSFDKVVDMQIYQIDSKESSKTLVTAVALEKANQEIKKNKKTKLLRTRYSLKDGNCILECLFTTHRFKIWESTATDDLNESYIEIAKEIKDGKDIKTSINAL